MPCQSGGMVRRLGHRGLQIVKLVESILRLNNSGIDQELCQHGILKACVDLMFIFDKNSLLHLAVQRIALMLIEGGTARRYVIIVRTAPGTVSSNSCPLRLQSMSASVAAGVRSSAAHSRLDHCVLCGGEEESRSTPRARTRHADRSGSCCFYHVLPVSSTSRPTSYIDSGSCSSYEIMWNFRRL